MKNAVKLSVVIMAFASLSYAQSQVVTDVLPSISCEAWQIDDSGSNQAESVVLVGEANSSNMVTTFAGETSDFRYRVIYSREGDYLLPKIWHTSSGSNADTVALKPNKVGRRFSLLSFSRKNLSANLSCSYLK